VINEAEYKHNVEMTIDSCFSGQMCYKAKELWEKKNRVLGFKSLFIMASTHKTKKAIWGKYRTAKMEIDKKDITIYQKTQVMQKYCDEIGITSFDSSNKANPIVEHLPLDYYNTRSEVL
tara:strand:- start:622 stop:978 length:357 start_codon:yes stop_codon:yes gene_type:complete